MVAIDAAMNNSSSEKTVKIDPVKPEEEERMDQRDKIRNRDIRAVATFSAFFVVLVFVVSWVYVEHKMNRGVAREYFMTYDGVAIRVSTDGENVTEPNRGTFKRYFFSPSAKLNRQSVTSSTDKVTGRPLLSFRIDLWDDNLKRAVMDHLALLVNHPVMDYQVNVMPFEKAHLSVQYRSPFRRIPCQSTVYGGTNDIQVFWSCSETADRDRLASYFNGSSGILNPLNLKLCNRSQCVVMPVAIGNRATVIKEKTWYNELYESIKVWLM